MKKCRIQILVILTLLLTAWLAAQPRASALWSDDKQFTTAISQDMAPSIAQSTDKRTWMFWHSKPMEKEDIYYNYTDNGITWSKGFRFTTDPSNDYNPSVVATRDGKMWVFWVTDRDGNREIYYKNSPNNGMSWSSEHRLTYSASLDRRPSAMQAQDGTIWLVWYSNRTGNEELWCRVYDGSSWGSEMQLTNNPNEDIEPCILQDNEGKIWVFWSAYNKTGATEDYELYYKTSSDYGANWSNEIPLTDYKNSWDLYPSAIQARDGTIWVVWMADRKGPNFDIYYKTSSDYGANWSLDEALIATSVEEKLPSILQSGDGTIWVAWTSDKGPVGDYNIFYKTTLNEHDVAIASVKPSKTMTYQGQTVVVEVVATNHGNNPETFEVKCYANSALIGSMMISLDPAQIYQISFPWNTLSATFGNYSITATANVVPYETNAEDNTNTDGTVQVKIPGDINGDGTVNVHDAVLMVHDLDATAGNANWNNGRSDINDDLRVSAVDVTILATNFGRTTF